MGWIGGKFFGVGDQASRPSYLGFLALQIKDQLASYIKHQKEYNELVKGKTKDTVEAEQQRMQKLLETVSHTILNTVPDRLEVMFETKLEQSIQVSGPFVPCSGWPISFLFAFRCLHCLVRNIRSCTSCTVKSHLIYTLFGPNSSPRNTRPNIQQKKTWYIKQLNTAFAPSCKQWKPCSGVCLWPSACTVVHFKGDVFRFCVVQKFAKMCQNECAQISVEGGGGVPPGCFKPLSHSPEACLHKKCVNPKVLKANLIHLSSSPIFEGRGSMIGGGSQSYVPHCPRVFEVASPTQSRSRAI